MSIYLWENDTTYHIYLDFRIDEAGTNETYFQNYPGGSPIVTGMIDPFPFVVGVQFEMTFSAVDERTLQVGITFLTSNFFTV